MKTIGITGGTGLIGTHLSNLLSDSGFSIVVFTRNPDKRRKYIKNLSYAKWDPKKKEIDKNALAKIDVLVHLAGEGIADKRWTEQRKAEILDSRIVSTEFITQQLLQNAPNCKVFIGASGIGCYGADNEHAPFKEDANLATDFLGHTCKKWEDASLPIDGKMRKVILRTGVVLSRKSGAFKEYVKPMKFGIMPLIGSGEQIVSWIHITDMVRMIRFAIERIEVEGVYNSVAPRPVSYSMMIHTIGSKKKGIKIVFPVPKFLLKLFVGELAIELLKSTTVSCEKIMSKGFKFEYPDIESAVTRLLQKPTKKKKKED